MDPEIAGHFYDISQKALVSLRNQTIALKKRINQLEQKPGETIKSECEGCKVYNFQEITNQ
jgi:BMFP domain-containing protein YqiC